jgi:hypothetical protein
MFSGETPWNASSYKTESENIKIFVRETSYENAKWTALSWVQCQASVIVSLNFEKNAKSSGGELL